MPEVMPYCRCGHHVDAHDAGECWTEPDAVEQPEPGCPCSWYEPKIPSLDQQIRTRLDARANDPGFLRHRDAAAIRAVLDLLDVHQQHAEPEHRQGINATAHAVRYTIARELGVTQEQP